MAKKGQKFKKYTPEQRKEVADKYLSGQGALVLYLMLKIG